MKRKTALIAIASLAVAASVPLLAAPANAAEPGSACSIDATTTILFVTLHGHFTGVVTADGQNCMPAADQVHLGAYQGKFDSLLVAGAPCNVTTTVEYVVEATTSCPYLN